MSLYFLIIKITILQSGLKSNLELVVRDVAEGLILLNVFRMVEQNDTNLVEIAERAAVERGSEMLEVWTRRPPKVSDCTDDKVS